MMSQSRAHLELVELDARIVPSGTKVTSAGHLISSAALHATVTSPLVQGFTLAGTGSGVVGVSPAHVRGGGTMFVLRGTADLTGVGHVNLNGGLTRFANGTASGQLILAGPGGVVRLQLSGNIHSNVYTYHVISSNLTWANSTGTLTLTLTGRSFTLTI
jgi:hypothetical protein